jgi:hypothetical protein
VREHDVVRFGNVRATVARASENELRVEVPPCLPAARRWCAWASACSRSLARTMLIEGAAPAAPIAIEKRSCSTAPARARPRAAVFPPARIW